MKKSSTIFLQVVLIIIAVAALALIIWEPTLEGRNVSSTLFQVYFNDPFLAYAYLGSVSFFVAIYQAFKLLTYIGQNKVFSQPAVNALRNIKYCGITLASFVLGAEAYLFIIQRSKSDDIAGGVAVGLFLIFASIVTATAAAVFQRLLQKAVDMKSENDLTV